MWAMPSCVAHFLMTPHGTDSTARGQRCREVVPIQVLVRGTAPICLFTVPEKPPSITRLWPVT